MSEPIADGVAPLPPVPDDMDGEHVPEHPQPAAGRHGDGNATEGRGAGPTAELAGGTSLLDHPAVLVALSLLALVALVLGIDQASQGNWVALVPALLLAAGYVLVVRRRRARR